MSESLQPFSSEGDASIEKQNMAVYELAEMLEGFARMYSSDYDEELNDGISAEIGSIELGGMLRSKITFCAERLRSSFEPYPQVPADVEMTEYTIKSSIKREGILFGSLPPEVYEYIDQFEDMNTADYRDNDEVALEYEQSYMISTDGEFVFENSLTIYVDGDGVSLPDDPTNLLPDEDDVARLRGEFDKTFFGEVFDKSEIEALLTSAKDIENEHRINHPIYQFYNYMEDMRYLSRVQRTELAGSIVRSIFSPESA